MPKILEITWSHEKAMQGTLKAYLFEVSNVSLDLITRIRLAKFELW